MTIEQITAELSANEVGGKARNVSWLIERGERVPKTWVVQTTDNGDEADLAKTLDSGTRYAVRSSANVEDSAEASYAGQFATELDISADQVPAAVARVRQSGQSERVAAYQDHIGSSEPVDVTVMIQPMVEPVVSGVAFSRNPMTGLNEVVIEAIAGRGDRLVGEGETPVRWIRRWGVWTEQPDSAPIDESIVIEIAATAARLATKYGRPVDIEWVWDGREVWLVQLRPITGLEDIPIYSNRISSEVLHGMIKPLVWSVNVPMVNQAWVDLFTRPSAPTTSRPGGWLARSAIAPTSIWGPSARYSS